MKPLEKNNPIGIKEPVTIFGIVPTFIFGYNNGRCSLSRLINDIKMVRGYEK